MRVETSEMEQFTAMMNWGIKKESIIKFSVYCNSDTMFISSIEANGDGHTEVILGMGSNLTKAMISYSNERAKYAHLFDN